MKIVAEVNIKPLLEALDCLVWTRGRHGYGMLQSIAPQHRSALKASKAHLTWPESFPAEAFCDKLMAEAYPGKKRGEIQIARLYPGQKILDHCDDAEGGCQIRVHVPLVTNTKAVFREEGKPKHMAVGKAYEINPSKLHGIVNGGKTDRIHLMFNVLEP